MEYQHFLAAKQQTVSQSGFEVEALNLNPMLFDWQNAIVQWGLRLGKAAIFSACVGMWLVGGTHTRRG